MTAFRPNILFIITDQQRYDSLGCNGHPQIRTPHLDALAAQGVSLDRHYTNHPICTPSRATLITGRYPRANRVYDNGCCLAETETTLPEILGEHGYTTRAIGKLHLSSWREPDAVSFESESFWAAGKGPTEPVPYAGFDLVEICTRHINPETGHYSHWLAEHYPEVKANWDDYLTPDPSGAFQVSDWTMPPEAHANTWIADRTCAFLDEQQGSDQPFFLHVGFPDPHHPFRSPDPWGSMYPPEEVELPDLSLDSHASRPPEYSAYVRGILNIDALGDGDFNTIDLREMTPAQHRAMHAKTYGMVSFVDDQVGRIIAALEATGQRDNTIIVYTSDHGDYLSDHGLILKGPLLLEGLVKVPFIVAGPAGLTRGERSSALSSHVDVLPTLLSLAGVPVPLGVQGDDLSAAWRGQGAGRDQVLVECYHQFMYDRNVKALITDDWKLVYWGGQTYGELYHLASDPGETTNLWDDPAHRDTRQRLLLQLLDELVVHEDTLPRPLAPT